MNRPSARAALAAELAASAEVLEAVQAGEHLDRALSAAGTQLARLPADSRAPVRDMCYHATRLFGLVEALARCLNARAPGARLAVLQQLALSQLVDPIRHPGVIVDQAVEAARLDRLTEAGAGFLNATLRRFLREREPMLERVRREPAARWNHPTWWIEQLRSDHPSRWEQLLEAGNLPPPLCLRVNQRRISAQAYEALLIEAGFTVRVLAAHALAVSPPCEVERLPGWSEGLVSVQDAGAQWAAHLLPVGPGARVLDACAAPGGKTAHLLERFDCDVTALDQNPARLAQVNDNLRRLGLSARLIAGDAADPRAWWDGRPFDHLLVDAPCTASGIGRRVPEARWLRRRGDLATQAAAQTRILEGLWPLLRPGGTLLFITCSVFDAEGPAVVERFLRARPDARLLPVSPMSSVSVLCESARAGAGPGIHLLPVAESLRDHDGFFYCLIGKRA